jgi:ribosome-binding protein aMBF1 (putative translation factor)
MAARSRPLTPQLSSAHLLGAVIRERRCQRGISQAALGRLVFASATLIRKIEHAERFPREDLVHRLDRILDAHGALISLRLEANADRRAAATGTGRTGWPPP